MGRRRMFPELLSDLEVVSDEVIIRALEEIATGVSCFGKQDEWIQWLHYLLPRLIERPWSGYRPIEALITGFMALNSDSMVEGPYPEFRSDALATLGLYIVAPALWPNGAPDAEHCLSKYRRISDYIGWINVGGLLSASLFFCLKYLPAEAVAPWLESVLDIPDPRWRSQLLVWMVGGHPILTGEISQPKDFPDDGPFYVGWDGSSSLTGNYSGRFDELAPVSEFLPADNRAAMLTAAHRIAADGVAREWLAIPSHDDVLDAETAGLEAHFATLYA